MPFVSYMLSKSCCSKYREGIRSAIELHWVQCWKRSFLLKHRPTPVQCAKSWGTCMLESTQSTKSPSGYPAALRCRPNLCPSQYSGPGHTYTRALPVHRGLGQLWRDHASGGRIGSCSGFTFPHLGALWGNYASPCGQNTLCLASVHEEQPSLPNLGGCVGPASTRGL